MVATSESAPKKTDDLADRSTLREIQAIPKRPPSDSLRGAASPVLLEGAGSGLSSRSLHEGSLLPASLEVRTASLARIRMDQRHARSSADLGTSNGRLLQRKGAFVVTRSGSRIAGMPVEWVGGSAYPVGLLNLGFDS